MVKLAREGVGEAHCFLRESCFEFGNAKENGNCKWKGNGKEMERNATPITTTHIVTDLGILDNPWQ